MNGLDRPMPLTREQVDLCRNTISSLTFYKIVGDALSRHNALSVVRMGDGEHRLLLDERDGIVDEKKHGKEWLDRLGLTGITNDLLKSRLYKAALECTYFAPSITGIQHEDYNLYRFFPARPRYVDNFFVNAWDDPAKIKLFQEAGHVLLIHNNAATADSMQIRAQANLDVEISYMPMSHWSQTEDVCCRAKANSARLVLFSGGPAGKYIAPEIASAGNKVVLDIGNSVDQWTLDTLPADLEKAQAFHRRIYGN